jgi:hypothetical protein
MQILLDLMNIFNKVIIILLVSLFGVTTGGWVRPEVPQPIGRLDQPPIAGEILDYLFVEVNGASRTVKSGQELTIVRGDSVLIKEAVLRNHSIPPKDVQVVGLMRAHHGRNDARGLTFRTKDLASRLSEEGNGQVYAVIVRSKKVLHGTVYIRIREATLRYAEVLINDTKRILRDGETLKLSSKDMFKLNKVVTNLEHDDGVVFQIAEGSHGERAIRFLRHGVAFATIPLIVEE